jgi:hypothetical protein
VSRDGGINWKVAKRGDWIYEIGDHGALIVIARRNDPTNDILFSLDEGLTFNRFKISEVPIIVENIIIEPKSASQHFLVFGSHMKKSGVETKAFFSFVDFSSMNLNQCQGIEEPGMPESDFEYWTPNDGRHGASKCFLGQKVTYVRRK